MSNQNETELMDATAAAIKEPRPKTELEKAREKIGPLKEVLKKEAEKNDWDIGLSDSFIKQEKPPVVRFIRHTTVADAVRAERLAKAHYGGDYAKYEPTGQEKMIGKLCVICTFDGGPWNILQIEKLGEGFFTNIVVRFSDYLG